MSNRRLIFDKRQRNLDLDFASKVDNLIEQKQELFRTARPSGPPPIENHEELCVEIAGAIKRAIKNTGLSREQIVDEINDYFGWTGKDASKQISVHTLNNYIAKPVERPIPAYLLFPIIRITGSLELLQIFAEPEGARIISQDEVKDLSIGKIDNTIAELQRERRELLKRGWR